MIVIAIEQIMAKHVDFEIVCPNDHDQTVTFSKDEFERTVKSGALVFHCNTCDTNWQLTQKEISKFREVLSKDPA